MRIRNIKPDFFKDEKVGELDPVCRLLFLGLWCLADKNGVLQHNCKLIKAELFPYDDITSEVVEKYLCRLCEVNMIVFYSSDEGRDFILIRNFLKHQKLTSWEKNDSSPCGPLPNDLRSSSTVLCTEYTEVTEEAEEAEVAEDGMGGTSASAYAEFISAFQDAHDQCKRVPDIMIIRAIQEARAEKPNVDVAEAISSFRMAWAGVVFSGGATPMKEFRKYLRGRNTNFQKKQGGGGFSGGDDYDPAKKATSPKKRREALEAGVK